MTTLIFYSFIAILAFTQLAFAGVHVWAYSIMAMSLYALFMLWIIHHSLQSVKSKEQKSLHELGIQSPAIVFLGLFLALVGLQLAPLPMSVIEIVSPQAADLYHKVMDITETSRTFSLSVVPYSTKIALLQVVAYTCAFVLVLGVVTSRARIKILAGALVVLGLFQVVYGIYQTYAAGQESIWWWPKEYYQGYVTGTYINKNNLAGFLELAIPMAFGLALASAGMPQELKSKGRKRSSQTRSIQVGSSPVGSEIEQERYEYQDSNGRVVVKKKISSSKASRQKSTHVSLGKRIKNILLGIEGRAQTLIWAFLGVTIGVGLLLTSSRGGIVSLVLAACFVGGLLFFKTGYRRWGGLVLGACLVVLIYGLSIGMHKTIERFERIDFGLQDRWEISKAAWPLIWDYPILGSGLDTFEHVFPAYAPPELMRRTFLDAHNDWLQMAIETGLVGFAIVFVGYIWFLAVSIRQWFQRRDPLAVGIGGGMIMALVSIGIHSLVDFNMHIPANALNTMIVAGLGWKALSLQSIKGRTGQSSRK
jgi:hypothetical protein